MFSFMTPGITWVYFPTVSGNTHNTAKGSTTQLTKPGILGAAEFFGGGVFEYFSIQNLVPFQKVLFICPFLFHKKFKLSDL